MRKYLTNLLLIVVLGVYYQTVLFHVSIRTSQWPFVWEDLLFFGFIPAGTGAIGILTHQYHHQRVFAWIVFCLGVAGIALSFLPWRFACMRLFEWTP